MAVKHERGKLKALWTIRRFKSEEDHKKNKPFKISKVEKNLFLNEGIDAIWTLVCGGTATAFDATNAYIGVGNGTTAAAATDTGLVGTSFLYKGMDSGYPTFGSGQAATFRATFTGTEANFAWQEFTVANGSTNADINLNRLVSNQGTKTSGQVWEITLELSIS